MSYKIRIMGEVQGVWFRESMRREAHQLNVTGWVENMPDGSVEAVIHGTEEAMQFMIQWCHSGPGAARVERVEVSDSTEVASDGFVIRH